MAVAEQQAEKHFRANPAANGTQSRCADNPWRSGDWQGDVFAKMARLREDVGPQRAIAGEGGGYLGDWSALVRRVTVLANQNIAVRQGRYTLCLGNILSGGEAKPPSAQEVALRKGARMGGDRLRHYSQRIDQRRVNPVGKLQTAPQSVVIPVIGPLVDVNEATPV